MEMIVTKDLGKTFHNGKKTVEAVTNVNLQVNQGQIFGFLGPCLGPDGKIRSLSHLLRYG